MKALEIRAFFFYNPEQRPMSNIPKRIVAPWGIELSLLRTTISSEFPIIKRLKRNADLAAVRFFATYGYFDLTCVKTLDSLTSPSSLTLDPDINESATFRFVSPMNGVSATKYKRALDKWATAVAIFLKIHPIHVEDSAVETRWKFATHISAAIPGSFVFCGFGTCELLVMLGGRNLPRLLRVVTAMRNPGKTNPLATLRRSLKSRAPLFADTSTFPLISYDNVHRRRRYSDLAGEVSPVISVSCDPESEAVVASNYCSDLNVLNVYGRHDLVVTWKDSVRTGEFVRIVNKMRTEWAQAGCVAHTTSYLETGHETSVKRRQLLAKRPAPARPKLPKLDVELKRSTLRRIEPAGLRAAVTDVALRLNACSRDWKINTHYADMLNTFEYIQQTADKVTEKRTPEFLRNQDRFELTRVVDLARRAILQRHAGLESRPELLAYAESPLLCDIRLLVAAASFLPRFLFDNLFVSRTAEQVWQGYVLFYGDSPRWLRQNILALPASAIFDPIQEWWKITHEAAHAVFTILSRENVLGTRFSRVEEYIHTYVRRGVDAKRMISEVFANWFDWNYVFQRETTFYISTIWQSWLTQPAVFLYSPQYLSRSLAIALASELPRFAQMRQRGRRQTHLIPYLKQKLGQIAAIICQQPDGARYMRLINSDREAMIFDLVERLHPFLFWLENYFETDCGLEGLRTRICPTYRSLGSHTRKIMQGQIVVEPILNPCALHLELLRQIRSGHQNIASDSAYVFSLANMASKQRRIRK